MLGELHCLLHCADLRASLVDGARFIESRRFLYTARLHGATRPARLLWAPNGASS
jgi:hypothetical protein